MSPRKTACIPEAHRDRHAHPTAFVFSILVDCSARNLRIRQASRQQQTGNDGSEQRKNLWISSSACGTRPERPIPAIPHPSEAPNPSEGRSKRPARRERQCTRAHRRPEPPQMTAAEAFAWGGSDSHQPGKSNETRGGTGHRPSIPPSACLPVLALCFADPAPARGAKGEWSSR